MTETIKLFIGGQWIHGRGRDTVPVINPATEKPVATLCMATEADLEHALEAAERGFRTWRAMPAEERCRLMKKSAELLRDRADALARVLTLEQGKTLPQAKGEIIVTAAYLDELANCAVRVSGRALPAGPGGVERRLELEPIGPVFAVSPWNLPAMMPGRKIGTSLAAGCSIIVKPATETPQTAYLIAACCQDAGIPDGVVNVVSGPSSLVSETMIASDVVRKVSFTGSTEVGKMLAAQAGKHMKKVTMELGGHAPVIVFDDIDVSTVIAAIVPARYHNAGQSCMAATRFFVHDGVYEAFVDAFSDAAAALRLGDGLDETTDMGPLTNERRVAVMAGLVEDAVDNGARITAGGNRPDRDGYFFGATVLADVTDDALIMQEEPFGPITPIARFDDAGDVIRRANSTPYGLAAYIYTRDESRASQVAAALDAGLVGINTTNIAGPTVPFGGVRDSGVGREGAIEGVLESMTTKTISRAGC